MARRLIAAALAVTIFGVIFLRAPEMVLRPSLPFDEGSKVFAHFYEHREPAQILRFKSGYMPLVGNLIGYFAVRLPTRLIPYGLAGAAVALTIVTYCLFWAKGFRRWLPSDFARALTCLLLAVAPLSDCILLTASDYSLWNLLGTLILLSALPPPKGTWRFPYAVLCNLLVWAHPLTLVILPLVLWRAFSRENDRLFYRVLLFNLIAHQVFGVAGIITTYGLWESAARGLADPGIVHKAVHSLWWTVKIIIATAFRTAFGSPSFAWAAMTMPALLVGWSVIIFASFLSLAIRIPRTRALLAYLSYLIITLTFLSCFLRYEDVHGHPIAFINYSPRYIYLQSLCFLILFAALVVSVCELRFPSGTSRVLTLARSKFWPGRLLLLLVLTHYLFLNTQFGHYFFKNTSRASPYYDPDPANGLIVERFFAELAAAESEHHSREGIRLEALKKLDWPIIVDTTRPRLPMHLRVSHRARLLAILLFCTALLGPLRRFWRKWVQPSTSPLLV